MSRCRHSPVPAQAPALRGLILAAALWGGAICGAQEASGTEDLQQDMERILAEQGLVGVSWVLLGGDSATRLGAAGLRDSETGAAMGSDTRFHVGSVTKSLVATGVLHLATTGELDLDAPVSRYLDAPRLANPWADTDPVTVRHLLDHTAGLDDARLWQMFSEHPDPDAPLVGSFPEQGLAIRSRPGTRFSYSNTGYGLLGLIIEAASGQRYEAVLDQRLLGALGMTRSTFEYTSQSGPDADADLAWGHIDDGSR